MGKTFTYKFKTMEHKINDISKAYFAAKKHISLGHKCAEDEDDENLYQSYIDRVQEAFESLDELEKTFINNEFFYEDYPFWWTSIYSKTSFYRYKRMAMHHFLEAYNHAI